MQINANATMNTAKTGSTVKDKKLLFTPRHDFFSLDAGALKVVV